MLVLWSGFFWLVLIEEAGFGLSVFVSVLWVGGYLYFNKQ